MNFRMIYYFVYILYLMEIIDYLGLARVGSACNFSPYSSRKNSAIIVIDDLLFRGILGATHEIGHV